MNMMCVPDDGIVSGSVPVLMGSWLWALEIEVVTMFHAIVYMTVVVCVSLTLAII